MCDAVYVYETDARGRSEGETAGLIEKGASDAGSAGTVEIIMDEQAAIDRAIGEAKPGDFLLLLVDDIEGATERLKGRSYGAQSDLGQT